MKNDLSSLMQQAEKMQENIQKAQKELAMTVVEGASGAGMVKVQLNGRYEAKKVELADSLLKEDKSMIEDLVAAAFNDAVSKVETTSRGKMANLMSGMNLPAGFDVPPGG